jgi:copper homeostasis protein
MALANPILEIAANSVASALAAQDGGATRVELCSALELGGLTPSHATIALARDSLRIPLYVLIRPRAGDFLYDDLEYETMKRDIELCASLGCDGVVLGALDADGNVDTVRCQKLIAKAGGMGVTFHRAFDCARDPHGALEDIIALGCQRVLTSGQRETVLQGAALIRELIDQARGRVAVMPGAGITSGNFAEVAAATGAREFHASAKRRLPSRMSHRSILHEMAEGELRSDVDEIRAMLRALHTTTTPERA